MALQPWVEAIAQDLSRRYGVRMTSGYRRGAVIAGTNRPSLHASGLAIDMAGTPVQMATVANSARNLPNVREVIHAGRIWTPGRGDRTHRGDPHNTHVHIGFWARRTGQDPIAELRARGPAEDPRLDAIMEGRGTLPDGSPAPRQRGGLGLEATLVLMMLYILVGATGILALVKAFRVDDSAKELLSMAAGVATRRIKGRAKSS